MNETHLLQFGYELRFSTETALSCALHVLSCLPIVSIDVLILLSSALESMAAHRTACGKVVTFGTLIEDSPNIKHSQFRVSNLNFLAPPLVQTFTHVFGNNL